MPRHTKLTPLIQKRVEEALTIGSTHRIACQYAGVPESTFYAWLHRGELGHKPFVEFLEAVKKAEGEGAVRWLLQIENAAVEGAWQAAAWKLERRYPHEYGKTVQEHTGKEGGPLLVRVVYEPALVEETA